MKHDGFYVHLQEREKTANCGCATKIKKRSGSVSGQSWLNHGSVSDSYFNSNPFALHAAV